MMFLICFLITVLAEYATISCILGKWDIWNILGGYIYLFVGYNVLFGVYYFILYVFIKKQIRKYNDKLDKKDETTYI